MRLVLLSVGRLKTGPERELVERYRSRIAGLHRPLGFQAFDVSEIDESRARSAAERRRQEGAEILERAGRSLLVAFDERGAALASQEFATRLSGWRDEGRAQSVLAVGGPDGLDTPVRERADLVLCFGKLTIPHGLVRVLAAEQVYRALTILSGHPYHRGEPGAG